MSNIVKINNTEMQVIEYMGQRVATLAQIDEVHARPEGTARRTFNDHKHRLVEGEDFFVRNTYEAREMGFTAPNGIVLISEQGYTMLVKPFTDDLAWQVQRQVVTGYFRAKVAVGLQAPAKSARPRTITRSQVAAGILLLRSAAEDLKFSPSSVLGGYQTLESKLGIAGLLPAYAIDAPASSTSGSSETTKSASWLLKKFRVGISPAAFNELLVQKGFLKEDQRPTSKGGIKKFKVCLNLDFGKNITSPKNPRESQPHWYEDKFKALLELVLPQRRNPV